MWNHGTCDCECNKACKIDKCFNIKVCPCEECLTGILVLACEDEILSTTETSLDNQKSTYEKK